MKEKRILTMGGGALPPGRNISSVLGGESIDLDAVARGTDSSMDFKVRLSSGSLEELPDVDTQYELFEFVTDGAGNRVRLARDRHLNRVVALRSVSGGERAADPRLCGEFYTEAKITAQLDHPAILPVYNLCRDCEKNLCLATKFVEGKSLRAYIQKLCSICELVPRRQFAASERRSLARRLQMFLNLCDAVSYAHHRDIIHCNLRPENVIIGRYNELYLVGWGHAEKLKSGISSSVDIPAGRPRTAAASGNSFVAPEAAIGGELDCRSDIFSMGLILFELVFLRPARTGREHEEGKLSLGRFGHRFGFSVPEDLRKIVARATDADPRGRYANLQALADDIRSFLDDEEVSVNPDHAPGKFLRYCSRHRRGMGWTLLCMLLVMLGAATLLLYRDLRTGTHNARQDARLAMVFNRGLQSGTEFDRQLLSFESALRVLAAGVAGLVENPSVPAPPPAAARGCNYRAAPADRPVGMKLAYSKVYRQKVSFDVFVCKEPQTMTPSAASAEAARFNELFALFLRTVAGSLPGGDTTNVAGLQNRLEAGVKPPLAFAYASLVDGLHMCYPFHEDYNPNYDPRSRAWYLAAAESTTGRGVWGAPYVDNGELGEMVITCSLPVRRGDGTLLGCVGGDIALSRLLSMIAATGNTGTFVKNKMLVDRSGRIIVSDRHGVSGSAEPEYVRDSRRLSELWNKGVGLFRLREKNREYLYFYMRIDALDWLYIERIDFEELMRYSPEEQTEPR